MRGSNAVVESTSMYVCVCECSDLSVIEKKINKSLEREGTGKMAKGYGMDNSVACCLL